MNDSKDCWECPCRQYCPECLTKQSKDVINLINRQQAKIEALQMDNEQLHSDVKNANMNLEHQQAEIERLKIENQSLRGAANSYKIHYNEARTEAVKEFAERLKDRIVNSPSAYPIESATLAFLNGSSHRLLEILEIIDNLVKEMAGDTE